MSKKKKMPARRKRPSLAKIRAQMNWAFGVRSPWQAVNRSKLIRRSHMAVRVRKSRFIVRMYLNNEASQ